ncbi:hypothetical protein BCV69DRAFT_297012 [Microstroma glucosiphilum]|uniref:C2H2-type domain-containing protein n=1 Tax=Pseudomicrostroma glucosiphilum TaxID=1684307 RepID=A0A316UDX1_9BASI|nr:hypothetical protein BCV69DRAFT_297012 [Pseudomicrostroma glucosiphilum]PWN23054.1 hypothetical protein BCV69DRAFT_297012 [Pseudomicrostroma glucosiphilum]
MKDSFTLYPYSPSPIFFAAHPSSSSPPSTASSSGYELEVLDSDWNRFEESKLNMQKDTASSTLVSTETSASHFGASDHSDVKHISFAQYPTSSEDQSQDLGGKDRTMDYVTESHARTHSSDLFSQESSFARSVSSRAASECDDMLTGPTEWQSLRGSSLDQSLPGGSIKQEASRSQTHLSHLYAGLSEAFSQQHLAESVGPHVAQVSHSMPDRMGQHAWQAQPPFAIHPEHYQRRDSECSGFSSNFNFEEFISERDQAAERAAASDYIGLSGQYVDVATPLDANPFFFQQIQDQQQGYTNPPSNVFPASSSSSVTSHHSLAYHSDSNLLRPSSASHVSSASSVAASSPRMIDSSLRRDGECHVSSPASSQGSCTGGSFHRSSGLVRSQSLRAYTQAAQVSHPHAYHPSLQIVSPSSAHFGSSAAFDLNPIGPNHPFVHPTLRRLARPAGSVRSSSTSDLHESLSCNPQFITPPYSASGSSHYEVHSTVSSPGTFQLGTQSLFSFYDNLESPSSSTVSSPQQWHSALASDDGHSSCGGTVAEEEETYRQPPYTSVAASPLQLSGSLPTRPSMLRPSSWAPAMNTSSPSSSSPSLAGQPMRSTRSSAGGSAAASSPYSLGSAFNHSSPGAPQNTQRLSDPYSGVITKRSRGRRVPSTPEEMTNVDKSGKVYTCKVPGCGKLFKRSEHLKRHIRSIHTDEKPFTCKLCCKKFSRHDNLNQHMRVHGESGMAGGDDDDDEDDEEEEGQCSRSGSSSRSPPSHAETRGGTVVSRRSRPRGKTTRGRGSGEDDVFSFEDDEKKPF